MKFFKKTILTSMCLVFALLLSACSSGVTIDGEGDKKTTNNEQKSNLIGFSVSTLNNPFFVTLVESAKSVAEENGLELVAIDAREDVAKQASDIEDLVSRGASILLVNPVDSDSVASSVANAISNGVKVISVDRSVNGVDVSSTIASDNVLGAELATNYLLETVGEGSEVAELMGVVGASATIDRGEGFHNVADKNLNVVASQSANFDRAEGLSVMENILQANPNIKGVFSHNDEMALGALEAIGNKDIKVIGFDAIDDAISSIKDGRLFATVAQQPAEMGKIAIETAMKLIKGEEVQKNVGVEVLLVKE